MDVNESKRQILKIKENKIKRQTFQASEMAQANFFFPLENKTYVIHHLHGAKQTMLKDLPTGVH